MAWKMSASQRRALVKLQLRDKNGRWIEMGRGVKWYSSKRKKEIGGTVVGSQGNYALVRLNKENPTHEPALVKVPARHIEVVSSKATLSDPKAAKSNLETPEFEKPEAVGRKQSNAFVKPSDTPEDYSISETSDGHTYISRKDGEQLYFPARSLDIGDELIAPDGGDETKPFSMGKAWAKKGAERLNTAGPKTGKVIAIEGDRYAIVQLPEGHTVDDKKNPGEQTDKVTVGLSNSVIKLTPGLKTALGDKLNEGFADNSEDDGGEEEVDPASPDAQSDHIGREVTDEQLAEEDDDEDFQEPEEKPTKSVATLKGKALDELEFGVENMESDGVDPGLRVKGTKVEIYDYDDAIRTIDGPLGVAQDRIDHDSEMMTPAERTATRSKIRGLSALRDFIEEEKENEAVAAEAPQSAPNPETSPEATSTSPDAPEAPEQAADSTLNENGLTAEDQKLADGYVRMAKRADDKGDIDAADRYQAMADAIFQKGQAQKNAPEAPEQASESPAAPEAVEQPAPKLVEPTDPPEPESKPKTFAKGDLVVYANTGNTYRVLHVEDDKLGVYRQNKNGDVGRYMFIEAAKAELVGGNDSATSETPASPELPPLTEGEELELPIPGVTKQGKRADKSAQHLKTLDGLEKGDRVSYTNAHDETSTYQKHEDGTWDLLDPEDEHEDLSPLEEAIAASDLANRHKRGDLEVSTVEDQEQALKDERYRNTDEQGRDYFKKNPEPKRDPKVIENRDLPKAPTRVEQEQADANSADKPWSVQEIQSSIREWFDFAQAVKDGDTRAIETMANNKRTGDEETDIIVNDKGQPFDITLTYNDNGDPVIRLSNFDDSKDIYGDFDIDASVMPKQLSTLIHESINADDVAAAVAERNGSNDVLENDFKPIITRFAGDGKRALAKAIAVNPDSGIEINGNYADVTDLHKAQDLVRDLVNDIQRQIDDPNARKAGKVHNNSVLRDLHGLLKDINQKQFEQDGKLRPHTSVRDAEPAVEAPEPEVTPEPEIESLDPEFKAVEDRYNKLADEAQGIAPGDPRRAAWDSAMDSGHQATLEGIERFSKEWYDTVVSSYGDILNDLEAEAAAEATKPKMPIYPETADPEQFDYEPVPRGTLITHTKTGKQRIVVRSNRESVNTREHITTRNMRDGKPFGPVLDNKAADFDESEELQRLFDEPEVGADEPTLNGEEGYVPIDGRGRKTEAPEAPEVVSVSKKLLDDLQDGDRVTTEDGKLILEKDSHGDWNVIKPNGDYGDRGSSATVVEVLKDSSIAIDRKSDRDAATKADNDAFLKEMAERLGVDLDDPESYVESAEDVPETSEDSSDPELDENGLTPQEQRDLEVAREEQNLGGQVDPDPESTEAYQKAVDDVLEKGRQRLEGDTDSTPEEVSDTVEETAPVEAEWVNPLDALDIVRREPMAIDGETYPPTQQQQDVIDAVLAGLDTKVQAMAGTGKTSTLVALSRRIKEHGKQAIYIAFNKTVQLEAEQRMEGLPVESKTGHGVAYNWALKKAPYLITRLNGQDPSKPIKFKKNGEPTAWADKWSHTSAKSIASDLGIKNGDVKDEAGQDLRYQTTVLAVRKTVEKFALSDKDDITPEHIPEDFEIHEDSKEEVVRLAKEYWKDLESENGNFRVTHDMYRKFWALSRPDLTDGTGGNKKGANILYIDEAQDTPPVLAKVVADQKMQKVIVGDPNQAIYAFAENIDYLSEADGDVELPLNKSWRFGPQVADIGNRFLEFLGSDDRVIGGGGESSIVYGMEDADAVLVRTNAGMLDAILDEVKRGRRVTAPDGTRADLDKLIRSVEALKEGEPLDYPHDDLIGFKNWGEVLSAHNNGDKSVGKIVKLFEVTDAYTLARAEASDIERMTREKMEKAKSAVKHLVQYVPTFETLKIEDEKIGDGTRTWVSGVDVHPDPKKKWTADDQFWATKNFSAELGKVLAPHAFDKKLGWSEQKQAFQKAGGLETIGFEYDRRSKRLFTDNPEAAALLKSFSGESDVTVSTAHKSKGLEWDRVRIGDDFFVPYEDKDGNMVYPEDPAEYKLGYVAVTRAAKELDPGILSWIYEQTSENGGKPGQEKAPEAPEAAEEAAPEVSAPEDAAPAPEQATEEAPIDTTPDTDESLETVSESLYDDDGLTPTEASRIAELDQQMADIYSGKSDAELKPVEDEWNDILEHGERRKKGQDLPEYEKPVEAEEVPEVTPEPEASPEPVVEEAPEAEPAPSADRSFSEYSTAEVADFPIGTKVWKGFAAYGGKQVRGYFEKTGPNEWADYRGGDLFKQSYVVDDGTVQFGQDHDPRMAPTFPEATPEPEAAPEVAPEPVVVEAPEYDVEGLTAAERRRADALEQAIYDAYRARKPETAKHLDTELQEILARGAERLKPKAPAPVAETSEKPKRGRRDFSNVPVHDANGTQIKVGDTIGHKRLGPVVITGFMPAAGRVTYIDPSTNKEASVKGSAVSIISEDVAASPEAVVRTGEPGDRFTDLTTGKQGFYGANGEPIIVGQRVTTKDGRSGLVKSVYTAKSGVAWIPVLWDDSGEVKRAYGNLLSLEGGPQGGNGGGGSPEPEAPEPTAPEVPEEPETPSVPEPAPTLSIKDSVEDYSGTEGFASSYDPEAFSGNPLSASGIRRFEEITEGWSELRRDMVSQYDKGADGSTLTHGVKVWAADTGEYMGLVQNVEVYDDDISIRIRKTTERFEREKTGPNYDPDYHSQSAVYDPKDLISKPPTLWDGSYVDFSQTESVEEINSLLFKHYPSVHFDISDDLELKQAKLFAKAISANFRKFPMLENSMNEVTANTPSDNSIASLGSIMPSVAVFSDQHLNINPYSAAEFRQRVNDGRGGWFNDVPNGKQADYIVTHEMGHALDGLTGWTGSARVYELLREYLAEQGITGLSNAELAKYLVNNKMISEYSAESWLQGIDSDEMVAEAFADVEINGVNAKPVNKMIHKELMTRLEGMMQG